MNKGKENIFVVSGLNGIVGPGPDGITNYNFYSGVIQVKILGNFNQMSIYTYNYGYAGGYRILTYGSQFDNYIPHSYNFTNESNLLLTDININYPTNQTPLIPSPFSYDLNISFIDNINNYSNYPNTAYNIITLSDSN